MREPHGPGEQPDADEPAHQPGRQDQPCTSEEVVYGPLQAWSRPHPAEGVVTVHFATREHPERRFTLTFGAARDLAIQLMRHSKRVRRAVDDPEGGEECGSS